MVTEAVRYLRGELPNIEIVTFQPDLAGTRRRSAAAKNRRSFLRPAQQMLDLAFKPLIKEPLIAVFRSDHRLAALIAFTLKISSAKHSSA